MTIFLKTIDCAICGKSINYAGIGRVPKTCSNKCKNKLDVLNREGRKSKELNCEHCQKFFIAFYHHQKFCCDECRIKSSYKNNLKQSVVYFYSCELCNTFFARKIVLRGAASNPIKCDQCRLIGKRIRYRKKTIKRQGAISSPKISVEFIAKRDNYICHLCDKPVDMDIPRTERLGATLDHIQPISKGGLDTMENVALAHWICNIKKGNK